MVTQDESGRPHRRHRSRAEADQVVAEYEASGLSREAFCKQKEDADKKEERVEIKYLVPEANIEMVAQRLKLDSDHPTETRVICFYDTAALTLFTRTPKAILRSRYSIGTDKKTGDTTVGSRMK